MRPHEGQRALSQPAMHTPCSPFKRLQHFYRNVQARIWPGLSYVGHIRSTAAHIPCCRSCRGCRGCQRTGDNLKRLNAFEHNAKARIWPGMSGGTHSLDSGAMWDTFARQRHTYLAAAAVPVAVVAIVVHHPRPVHPHHRPARRCSVSGWCVSGWTVFSSALLLSNLHLRESNV